MDEKKRLRVWKVQAAGTEKSYKAFAFQAVLALTILAGCVRALFQTWGLQQIGSVELEAILIGILGARRFALERTGIRETSPGEMDRSDSVVDFDRIDCNRRIFFRSQIVAQSDHRQMECDT